MFRYQVVVWPADTGGTVCVEVTAINHLDAVAAAREAVHAGITKYDSISYIPSFSERLRALAKLPCRVERIVE